MKKVLGSLALALFVAIAAPAQAQTGKVAVINIQSAIVGTKDGQKAAADLDAKYGPRRKQVDARQAEIAGLRDQLQKGQNTLSEAAKNELYRNIDQKTKTLNRDIEDAQAELQQDQDRLMQDLSQKIVVVIDKYAKDNGFALVLDVSAPQTPVIYASNTIDITKEIVDLYDKSATAMAPAAKSSRQLPSRDSDGAGLLRVVYRRVRAEPFVVLVPDAQLFMQRSVAKIKHIIPQRARREPVAVHLAPRGGEVRE